MTPKSKLKAFRANLPFLSFSLLVHLTALAVLFVWGLRQVILPVPRGMGTKLDIGPPPVQLTFMTIDLKEAGLAQPSDSRGIINVLAVLREAEERAARLSSEQRLRELEKRLSALGKMSMADVDHIASVVEKVRKAAAERQFAPVEGIEGPFDIDSTLLYDIEKVTDEKGEVTYVFTLVDKDGRQLLHVVKEKDMSASDLAAYRVFEMARGSAALKRLVETVQKAYVAKHRAPAPASEKPAPAAPQAPPAPAPEGQK